MTPETAGIDIRVRVEIFRCLIESQHAPRVGQVASATGLTEKEAAESLERLADGRAIVLKPGTHEIWMANPFSAVPTTFFVEADGKQWYANCIWDSFGILGLLNRDGAIRSICPDCGAEMSTEVRGGRVVNAQGIVHFAVPAAHWWDDIGYT